MLGEGMLGELGGGELLLDEQPASVSAVPSSRAGRPPLMILSERRFERVALVMRSAPWSPSVPAGYRAFARV